MMSLFGILLALAIIVLVFGIIFAIPMYVYNDAKKRGMNAWLWALVAFCIPGFVGLIIYLLVRSQESAVRCPNCQQVVHKSYTHCPQCGEKLKENCPYCQKPIEPNWSRCAFCGETIPDYARLYNVVPFESQRDNLKPLVIVLVGALVVTVIAAVLIGLLSVAA